MPLTPAVQYGRLEMDYEAYGKPHKFRVWVNSFNEVSAVGTFDTAGTPASLDALATELTSVLIPLYNAGAALTFGAWRGIKTTVVSTGAGIPVVEGTITPGSGTPNASANVPGAVSQMTASFRDATGKIVKMVLLGAVYAGPTPFVYSGISGGYLAFVNYLLGSTRITGRSAAGLAGLIDMSFDTNDGLTRRYRR